MKGGKRFLLLGFIILLVLCLSVSARQFTPQGDINLSSRYVIVGWNLSHGIFNVTVNDTDFWDGLNQPENITTMGNVTFTTSVTADFFFGNGSGLVSTGDPTRDTDGVFLSNNTTSINYNEVLLNSTITGLIVPDTNTQHQTDGVFLTNNTTSKNFNETRMNQTINGSNVTSARFWDGLDSPIEITSLGNITIGNWSAQPIIDLFLNTLNASKLFNLAALNNEITILVANITDVINLLDTHLHSFENITEEPWLEDGSLSNLHDANITNLSLSKITGADVNCSEGYVGIFNASNGTIICRVDPAFNYTMNIADALLGANAPNGSNLFATLNDLTNGTITVTQIQVIRNIESSAMLSGTPVRFVAYNSGLDRQDVLFATNNESQNHADCLVLGTLGSGNNGQCVVSGKVTNLDTSDFVVDDDIYLNETPGTFTNLKPVNASCIQKLGMVLRSHPNQGVLWISGADRCNDAPYNFSIQGNITAGYYFGNASFLVSFPDTNASTACSGTTTYLDGENNCDDISSVYLGIGDDTNASTACAGDTTYLSGEGDCNDLAPEFVNVTGDSMSGSLNMTNNSLHGVHNITFVNNESFNSIHDNGTCIIITAGATTFNVCA